MNKCLQCKKEFLPKPSTKGIYCSYPCYWESLKGIVPKGAKLSPIKKGATPWNKDKKLPQMSGKNHWSFGKRRPEISGRNHYKWTGDSISYDGVHHWVKKYIKDPKKCEFCGGNKNLNWANKSGKYLRSESDWLRLCRLCHINYDKPWLIYGLKNNNTSGFRGVSFDKSRNKWISRVGRKQLGRFSTKEEAALAYNKEAQSLWGDSAYQNKI